MFWGRWETSDNLRSIVYYFTSCGLSEQNEAEAEHTAAVPCLVTVSIRIIALCRRDHGNWKAKSRLSSQGACSVNKWIYSIQYILYTYIYIYIYIQNAVYKQLQQHINNIKQSFSLSLDLSFSSSSSVSVSVSFHLDHHPYHPCLHSILLDTSHTHLVHKKKSTSHGILCAI